MHQLFYYGEYLAHFTVYVHTLQWSLIKLGLGRDADLTYPPLRLIKDSAGLRGFAVLGLHQILHVKQIRVNNNALSSH